MQSFYDQHLAFIIFIRLGAAGVLAGHPLDTVKARLQTQKPGTYRGPLHCFTSIIKTDNARGLYKGKL